MDKTPLTPNIFSVYLTNDSHTSVIKTEWDHILCEDYSKIKFYKFVKDNSYDNFCKLWHEVYGFKSRCIYNDMINGNITTYDQNKNYINHYFRIHVQPLKWVKTGYEIINMDDKTKHYIECNKYELVNDGKPIPVKMLKSFRTKGYYANPPIIWQQLRNSRDNVTHDDLNFKGKLEVNDITNIEYDKTLLLRNNLLFLRNNLLSNVPTLVKYVGQIFIDYVYYLFNNRFKDI